jgi:hypothetical protein
VENGKFISEIIHAKREVVLSIDYRRRRNIFHSEVVVKLNIKPQFMFSHQWLLKILLIAQLPL